MTSLCNIDSLETRRKNMFIKSCYNWPTYLNDILKARKIRIVRQNYTGATDVPRVWLRMGEKRIVYNSLQIGRLKPQCLPT